MGRNCHLNEGCNPKIISEDIDEMKSQLEVMRAEVMRRVLAPKPAATGTEHQSDLADKAFANYDFGEGVMVTDTSGWEYTTPGHERTRKVYVESAPEDDGPAPRWALNFTVRFDPSTGELADAFALDDKGQKWGSVTAEVAVLPPPVQGDAPESTTGSSLENFPFPLEFSTMNDLPEIGVSCQDVFVTNPFYDHGMTTKVDPLECWGISESHAQFIVDLNDELGEAVEDAINAACARLQNVAGIKDGGFAGVFFSGHEIRQKLMEVLAEYITTDFNGRDFWAKDSNSAVEHLPDATSGDLQESVFLPLNRRITNYSLNHPDEQAAYERMQVVGFKIAETLMQKPRGTMAVGIQGHAYWVSPLNGMSDLFCTSDYEPLTADTSNVFAVSGFEGQSADDLDQCRQAMEQWLSAPQFVERDAAVLDALVAVTFGGK